MDDTEVSFSQFWPLRFGVGEASLGLEEVKVGCGGGVGEGREGSLGFEEVRLGCGGGAGEGREGGEGG